MGHNYNKRYSAGAELGIEIRKPINGLFTLFHGPNINYVYTQTLSRYYDATATSPEQKSVETIQRFGIPYTIGIIFTLTKNICLSAEINPSINYNEGLSYLAPHNF